MQVIATAGHVDHGKSALLQALTGTDPDRWALEKRRGMTLDLGFVWTRLPSGLLAFVDVPGHQRFVPTMLAGVGPVPAVLFVVAADQGWSAQSSEHLAALDALAVGEGVLVVTRCDLADPQAATRQALDRLGATSLRGVGCVAVSARTGAGMQALRHALDQLVARLPEPDPGADVRLWVDRAFSVKGAGTVVTGTLQTGRIAVGDRLSHNGDGEVLVRGMQTLGEDVDACGGISRVALNLRGADRDQLHRGNTLTTLGAWWYASVLDVRLELDARLRAEGGQESVLRPSEQMVLHVGAAAVPVRVRPLGAAHARLMTARPLPLRIGDRLVLREPGARSLLGAVVLDVEPPALARRRGAAVARGSDLGGYGVVPDGAGELTRRGMVRPDRLRQWGSDVPTGEVLAGWLVHPRRAAELRAALGRAAEVAVPDAMSPGAPPAQLAAAAGVQDARLVRHLLPAGWVLRAGRVVRAGSVELPAEVVQALDELAAQALGTVRSLDRGDLAARGIGPRELAAAEGAGRLLRLEDAVVVLAPVGSAVLDALAEADPAAAGLTLAQVRDAWGCSRRVALAVLAHLSQRTLARRGADGLWRLLH